MLGKHPHTFVSTGTTVRTSASIPLLSASLILAGACAGSLEGPTERMFDHYGRAGQIQTALIVGDLEASRRPAAWLAEHEAFAGLPTGSEQWVDEIRGAARAVRDADSIDQAADATARLASACAGCHAATDGGPRFRSAAPPASPDQLGSHMVRHLWGVDRMWEGVIGGSAQTWNAGARAIADSEPHEEFPGGSTTATLAQAVHDQAARALHLPAPDRPALYAEILKTCAGCHSLVGVAPPR